MSEMFAVGFEFNLVERVSEGLKGMSERILETSGHAEKLKGVMEHLGVARNLGVISLGVSGLEIAQLRECVGLFGKLEAQQARLSSMGLDPAQLKMAQDTISQSSARIDSLSETSATERYVELRSGLDGGSNADRLLKVSMTTLEQSSELMKLVAGHEMPDYDKSMLAVAQSMGGDKPLTSDLINDSAKKATKSLALLGGGVSGTDLAGALTKAHESGSAFGDHFAFSVLPLLLSHAKEMDGGKGVDVGQAFAEMNKTLLKGQVANKSLPMWIQSGLLKRHDVVKDKEGGWHVRAEALKKFQAFGDNPKQWIGSALDPAVKKLSTIYPNLSRDEIETRLFGSDKAHFIINDLLDKSAAYNDFSTKRAAAPEMNASLEAMKAKSPTAAGEGLANQWEEIKTTVGKAFSPITIGFDNALSKFLKGVNEFLKDSSLFTQYGGKVIAGMIAVTAVGGLTMAFASLLGKVRVIRAAWKHRNLLHTAFEAAKGGIKGCCCSDEAGKESKLARRIARQGQTGSVGKGMSGILAKIRAGVQRGISRFGKALKWGGGLLISAGKQVLRAWGPVRAAFMRAPGLLMRAVGRIVPSISSAMGALRSLSGVAGSLSGPLSQLPLVARAGLLGAAGAVGYGIGTLISHGLDWAVSSTDRKSSFGNWLYEKFHADEVDPTAPAILKKRPPGKPVSPTPAATKPAPAPAVTAPVPAPVSRAGNDHVAVNVVVQLDGKALGKALVRKLVTTTPSSGGALNNALIPGATVGG